MAYTRLTQAQKSAMRKQLAESATMSHKHLARWATSKFKLPQPPSRTTIHRILREQDDSSRLPSSKSTRAVTSSALDDSLATWVRTCEELHLPVVTGETIREKASKIREGLIAAAPDSSEALAALRFSNGWLGRFLKRHGLSSRRLHGEAASANQEAVKQGRKDLKKITQGYAKRDVFNMDETAYFYCSVPSRSISTRQLSGRKMVKKRLTVAIACNADGSTKLPLLFVGSSRQPRCFRGKSASELGVDYASTAKAWMTTQLFQSWVNGFNDEMREEGRHVLLLLDNVSTHRASTPLSHVTIKMLPPNTTAFLQPQDAGIIRQFKAQVRKRQNRHALDHLDSVIEQAPTMSIVEIEEAVASYNHIDILVAMRWAQEAWDKVTSASISGCWRHTGILDDDMYSLVDSIEKLCIAPHTMYEMLN